jgi:hypothetical protein
MADQSPFEEDSIVASAADLIGCDMFRSPSIVVTDKKALEAQGLVKKSVDYYRVRQLLNDGVEVQGAEFGPIEFRLRKRNAPEGEEG